MRPARPIAVPASSIATSSMISGRHALPRPRVRPARSRSGGRRLCAKTGFAPASCAMRSNSSGANWNERQRSPSPWRCEHAKQCPASTRNSEPSDSSDVPCWSRATKLPESSSARPRRGRVPRLHGRRARRCRRNPSPTSRRPKRWRDPQMLPARAVRRLARERGGERVGVNRRLVMTPNIVRVGPCLHPQARSMRAA